VEDGVLHPEVLKVFYCDEKDRQSPPIDLHMHQLKSVQAYAEGKNYLVSTTASGPCSTLSTSSSERREHR
jgi:hypothetical protein